MRGPDSNDEDGTDTDELKRARKWGILRLLAHLHVQHIGVLLGGMEKLGEAK